MHSQVKVSSIPLYHSKGTEAASFPYLSITSAFALSVALHNQHIHGGILVYLLSFMNISVQEDLRSDPRSDNQQYVLLGFLLNFFLRTVRQFRLSEVVSSSWIAFSGWMFITLLLCSVAVIAEYDFMEA